MISLWFMGSGKGVWRGDGSHPAGIINVEIGWGWVRGWRTVIQYCQFVSFDTPSDSCTPILNLIWWPVTNVGMFGIVLSYDKSVVYRTVIKINGSITSKLQQPTTQTTPTPGDTPLQARLAHSNPPHPPPPCNRPSLWAKIVFKYHRKVPDLMVKCISYRRIPLKVRAISAKIIY